MRSGLPNQDACDHSQQGNVTVMAIADGHGGSRHFRSQIGSALAVQSALNVLAAAGANSNVPEAAKEIESVWRTAVFSDLERNPFSEAELATLANSTDGPAAAETVRNAPILAYGATLLAAAATDSRILLLQIGDGDILAVSKNGETTRPVPADDRLIGNQTTSLCQPEAWKEFRGAVLRIPEDCPELLLLSTDGYANSFKSEEDFLKIGKDYLEFIRDRGLQAVSEELPAILTEASQNGSADDITLGILHTSTARVAPLPLVVPEEELSRRETKSNITPLILILLAVVAGLGIWAWLSLRPVKPVHSGPASAPVATVPKTPEVPRLKNPPPPGKQWMLDAGSGHRIPLKPGATLSAKQLLGDGGKAAYAKVQEKDHELVLVNESHETWTLSQTGAEDRPITHSESFPLAEDAIILLNNHRRLRIMLSETAK